MCGNRALLCVVLQVRASQPETGENLGISSGRETSMSLDCPGQVSVGLQRHKPAVCVRVCKTLLSCILMFSLSLPFPLACCGECYLAKLLCKHLLVLLLPCTPPFPCSLPSAMEMQ